ncbi:MAG: D-alanyl-D-alanine carboxypeptidase family protein [Candidatus Binatia bacterium]
MAAALATVFLVAPAAGAAPTAQASRYASIVIEAETGNVLYERNADLPRYPASLTKIMTLYMAFEALAAKKLCLTDEVTVSAHAAGRDPSRLNLAPGSRLKLEDAVRAMTTKSANDAACAVAEALGKGSETRFAEAMTAKAKTLGLQQTTFRNASGLPEDGQISTARDLALLSRALVRDFPEQYRYFSTDSFQFHGTRYPNQNRFLQSYYGADGIKTGFINASGHNLAASAVRGGKRLIAIVLGGDTQKWTREHTTRLLDVSFAKIDPSLVMVASNAPGAATSPAAGAPAEATARVVSAATATAPAPTLVATPAGAVAIAPALVLPNATANLKAYAAANSGSGANPVRSIEPARAAAAAVPAETPVTAAPSPAAAAPSPVAAAPAPAAAPLPVAGALMARADNPAAAAEPVPARSRPVSTAVPPAVPIAARPAPAPAPTPEAGEPVSSSERASEQGDGDWSVQVGLYRDATVARRRGEEARSQMPLEMRGADLVVGRAQDGIHVTSRISRLSEQNARAACSQLQRGRVPCVVVPPGRPLVVATN